MCSHLLKHKLPPHTRLVDQTQITWFTWPLCVVDSGLPLVGNTTEDALQLLYLRRGLQKSGTTWHHSQWPSCAKEGEVVSISDNFFLCGSGEMQISTWRQGQYLEREALHVSYVHAFLVMSRCLCCSSWQLTLSLLVISFFFHFWSSIHHGQEDRDWYRSWNHLQFLGSTLGKLEGSSHICTGL